MKNLIWGSKSGLIRKPLKRRTIAPNPNKGVSLKLGRFPTLAENKYMYPGEAIEPMTDLEKSALLAVFGRIRDKHKVETYMQSKIHRGPRKGQAKAISVKVSPSYVDLFKRIGMI